MKRSLSIALCLFTILLWAPHSFAEIKTFVKEYSYQASELDSKSTSRTMALEQAKRMLLEELGVFLVSKTDVVNFVLTKDQITTITAGIVSAEVLDERWDGHVYWLKAKIDADPYIVQQAIEVISNDTKKTSELDAARKRIDALTKDLEAIKNDLGSTPQERQKRYTKVVNEKQAMDWMLKVYNTLSDKKSFAENKEALDAVNKAIEIDPEYSDPYLVRAYIYGDIAKDNQKAIEDITKAIKYLKPGPPGSNKVFENAAGHYEYRALLYKRLGQLPQAASDLMKALELDPGQILRPLAQWKLSDIDLFIKKYPKDYRGYVFRGRFNSHFISRSDNPKAYDQALIDLKKALKIQSKNPVIYYVLVDAYRYKAQDYDIRHFEKLDPVNHQNIVDMATQGIKLNAGDIWKERFLNIRAEEYLTLKKYKLAISDYNELIIIKPDYAGTYHDRAIAYKETGEYDSAIKDLTKAIGMKHDRHDWPRSAYEIRAHVYEAMEKYEDAINDYSKAIEIWKKASGEFIKKDFGSITLYQILDNRAKNYRKIKQYQKAIDDYTEAISWLPAGSPSITFADRGDTYIEMEKPAEAIREYDKALEINAKSETTKEDIQSKTDTMGSEYLVKKAEAYATLEKFELAIQTYNKALDAIDSLPPFKGKIYQEIGFLYKGIGINKEAIKALTLAIKYLPLGGENTFIAYAELGSIYSEEGDHQNAIRVFTEMINSYPKMTGAYVRRGSEYYESKDYNKSIADFDKAIDLMPTNQFAYYYRALTRIRLEQHKQATEDLRVAARLGHKEAQDLLKENRLDW